MGETFIIHEVHPSYYDGPKTPGLYPKNSEMNVWTLSRKAQCPNGHDWLTLCGHKEETDYSHPNCYVCGERATSFLAGVSCLEVRATRSEPIDSPTAH